MHTFGWADLRQVHWSVIALEALTALTVIPIMIMTAMPMTIMTVMIILIVMVMAMMLMLTTMTAEAMIVLPVVANYDDDDGGEEADYDSDNDGSDINNDGGDGDNDDDYDDVGDDDYQESCRTLRCKLTPHTLLVMKTRQHRRKIVDLLICLAVVTCKRNTICHC